MTILAAWQDAGGPSVELATLAPPDPAPLARSTERLDVRAFTRSVDTTWRRTSYSSLSAASASHAGAGGLSEPEVVPDEDSEVDRGRPGRRRPRPIRPRRRVGAVADGRRCRSARPSARWSTRCSSTPTPRAEDFRGELLRLIGEQLVWWPVDLDPSELADALVAVCTSPLGPLADDRTLLVARPARPAARARLRGPAGRRRHAWPRPPTYASATWRRCCAATCRRATPSGSTPTRWTPTPTSPPSRCAATSTGSIDVVLRVDVRRPRALPHRRLQDQLARPDRPAADGPRLPTRRCSTRRWRTPTTRSRRCSTPWCCTGSCAGGCPATTRRPTSAACSTSTCAACAGPRPRGVDGHAVRGVLVAAAGGAGRGALRPARRGGAPR